MKGIGGIIFDKDGTLFDFYATWGAWAETFFLELAGGDGHRAEDIGLAVGYLRADRASGRRGQFLPGSPVVAGTPEEVSRALLPLLPGWEAETLVALMNRRAAEAPMAEVTPLAPLLSGLRARALRLGVATNDAETPARAHLDAAGITGFFDFIAGSDSGHGAKPEAGQLMAFAHAMGIAPARIAMVGDSRHDLVAARAAGMRPVAVLTGTAAAEELAPEAEIVLPDIAALPGWLDVQD